MMAQGTSSTENSWRQSLFFCTQFQLVRRLNIFFVVKIMVMCFVIYLFATDASGQRQILQRRWVLCTACTERCGIVANIGGAGVPWIYWRIAFSIAFDSVLNAAMKKEQISERFSWVYRKGQLNQFIDHC